MRTDRDAGTADSGVLRGPARPGGGPVSGARAVERRSPSRLLLPALLAAVFCVSLAEAPGGEVWRHMAVGRYLLQARSFPPRDVFSFTGASWDKKEWLFDVFAYLVHRAGGAGLMALVSPALRALGLDPADGEAPRTTALRATLHDAAARLLDRADHPELDDRLAQLRVDHRLEGLQDLVVRGHALILANPTARAGMCDGPPEKAARRGEERNCFPPAGGMRPEE